MPVLTVAVLATTTPTDLRTLTIILTEAVRHSLGVLPEKVQVFYNLDDADSRPLRVGYEPLECVVDLHLAFASPPAVEGAQLARLAADMLRLKIDSYTLAPYPPEHTARGGVLREAAS